MDEILKKKLDKILSEGIETLSIEFKREWHWNRKAEDTNKESWDKFLRNFSGLINTTEEDYIPIKYFIIGYDEKTKKTYDYKIDIDKNLLLFFKDKELIDIKKEIIKKLKKRFEIINYGEENFSKEDFEKLLDEKITITTHEYKNNELLIFVIEPLPFLLALKENNTLGTIKEKEIPYRKIKNKEPGIFALDRVHEITVKKLILQEWNKYKLHSPKNSIQIIVEAYNSSFYKKGRIINYDINRPYSNSDFYEIFGLEHRGKKEILFIYFSKNTSIKKTFEEILENHSEIGEYKDIFLIFENTHNIHHQRFKFKEHPKVLEVDNTNITLVKGKKKIECFSPIFEFIDKKNYQDIKIELKEENFFFLGNITGVFIEPFVKETNKSILDSLNLWMDESLSPIKFIIGEGGIGKTTVVKNFSKSIKSKSPSKDILFIDARDLIDKISSVKINSLYSFVKLFIEKEDDILSDELLNESMFNILLDSGKFLIIIDGLDEAIINSKEFDSIYFIKNIYENCLDNLGKTKILCTIRNRFWEDKFEKDDIGNKIEKLTLKGFNKDLAYDFFQKRLIDSLQVKEAITKMEKILGEKEEYIPSHLDMVIDILEDEIPNKLKSDLLSKDIDIDSLIYGICDRECAKFEKKLKTIDEQLNIFIEISISYSGECTEKQFRELTAGKYESYMSHNLLNSIGEDENKKYELRYDFLKEDFKELFFLKLLKDILDETESIEKLLEKKNKNLILKLNLSNLKMRAKYLLKIEDMKYLFLLLFEVFESMDNINAEDRELISFLFSFTLNLLNKSDKPNNTDLLKELFLNESDKKLYYVSFFNSKIIDKKTFDFRGLKFSDAYIDYKYFGDSDFDNNTLFEKSTILGRGCLDKCNFKKENFSDDCQLSDEIKMRIDESEDKSSNAKDEVTESIKKVLKKLYKNNFIPLKKIKIKKNLKGLEIKILNFLIKESIIQEYKGTSREKRVEEFLEISSIYQPLLEEVLEGQKSTNNTLIDIVNKFITEIK